MPREVAKRRKENGRRMTIAKKCRCYAVDSLKIRLIILSLSYRAIPLSLSLSSLCATRLNCAKKAGEEKAKKKNDGDSSSSSRKNKKKKKRHERLSVPSFLVSFSLSHFFSFSLFVYKSNMTERKRER